jgi:cobalt-zinc-cadmium efflux system protein
VLPRTWILLRDTTHILLQGVPRGFDLKAIRAAMSEVDGVAGVHDLHLWSVAGDDASLTVHVAVVDGVKAEAIRWELVRMLAARFNIQHATIQTEIEPCGDEESFHD